MNAQDALKSVQGLSAMVLKSYINDLSDNELLRRPGVGCNHLAWQLGHLIASECHLLNSVCPGAAIALPEGFAAKHGKETAGSDDPAQFCTKQQYLDLFDKVQSATAAALDKLSAADLDQPSPENYRAFAPTVGAMFALMANHPMMHAGQFVPVRRALGKPILM
jgi:hypothetical protein